MNIATEEWEINRSCMCCCVKLSCKYKKLLQR